MLQITPYVHRAAFRDPFSELEALERCFFGKRESSIFSTDIKDEGDKYRLEAELPGFDRESINVELNNGYMTVSAERRNESSKNGKNDSLIYSERSYGSFKRCFSLEGIDEEGIDAEYRNGVLSITLPKKTKPQESTRRLEVK